MLIITTVVIRDISIHLGYSAGCQCVSVTKVKCFNNCTGLIFQQLLANCVESNGLYQKLLPLKCVILHIAISLGL